MASDWSIYDDEPDLSPDDCPSGLTAKDIEPGTIVTNDFGQPIGVVTCVTHHFSGEVVADIKLYSEGVLAAPFAMKSGDTLSISRSVTFD